MDRVIFIDSGALIARYLKRDQYSRIAKRAWHELSRDRRQWFTSNFVIGEALTLLGRKAGYLFAAERGKHIYGSEAFSILRSTQDDELEALELFEKYADQSVSFTDCLSFVFMRRQRIPRAFTFDRHFRDAGFEVWPAGEFERTE
jgi:predicted nucleic acid-binding protein